MALLWTQAMAWHDSYDLDAEAAGARPSKQAGFAGYVGHSKDYEDELNDSLGDGHDEGFDEHLWDRTYPEPTHSEQAHLDQHGELPDSHWERHEEAYGQAKKAKDAEDTPDHRDPDLHEFVAEHGSNNALWQSKGHLGKVSLRGPVYATQSHVGQFHVDRYRQNPHDESWATRFLGKHPDSGGYLAHEHPMFVTHQGRLHVTDGHHRVAAVLQDGKDHIVGWHYDADRHGFPASDEED